MLSNILPRNDGGIGRPALAIVGLFTVFALYALTQTASAASKIDMHVKDATHFVGSADQKLLNVPKLDQFVQTIQGIETAAKPLSGQLDTIIGAGKSIDSHVAQINSVATSINATAKSINGVAGQINASFTALGPVVNDIDKNIALINGRADVILAAVQGINADLGNVLHLVGGPAARGAATIASHANSIDCFVNLSGGACKR